MDQHGDGEDRPAAAEHAERDADRDEAEDPENHHARATDRSGQGGDDETPYIVTYSHSNAFGETSARIDPMPGRRHLRAMDSPERITRIHEEIKQTRPFRSRSQEAMIAIARAASMVERRDGARPGPVRPLDGSVQRAAHPARCRIEQGCRPWDPGSVVDPAAAITRLVDRLDRAGLIARERTETDRRQVTCRITEAGLESVGPNRSVVDALDDMLLSRLQEDELEAFNRQLDRIRAEGLRAGGSC